MCAKIISIDEAVEMKNEYKSRIQPLIETNKGNGYKATEFAWIDLKTLKEYIETLDKVSSLNGAEVSGVRIYFSAYAESTIDNTAEGIYSGRESLFMVPTVEVAPSSGYTTYTNLQHVPFCVNPNDSAEPHKGTLEVIEDLLHAKDSVSGLETNDYAGKTSYVMNRFGVTPPPE